MWYCLRWLATFHPVAILHLLIIVTRLTCFITGAGLYFSARFARTTSAVVASFGLMLGLWVVGPVLAGLVSLFGARGEATPFVRYMLAHPAVQTELVLAGAGGRANGRAAFTALRYGRRAVLGFGQREFGVERMSFILAVTALIYISAGLLFFLLAQRRLRRSIF